MRIWRNLAEFERVRSEAIAGNARIDWVIPPSGRLPTVRIYYGPPGTGKTLAAIEAAVSLADPAWRPSTAEPGPRLAEYFRRFWTLAEQVEFMTFSPSDQYETVVEAIRPRLSRSRTDRSEEEPDGSEPESPEAGDTSVGEIGAGHELDYSYWRGPVLRVIEHAARDPERQYVLVIDEINRADVSQVLGPLFASIEPDKRRGADYPLPFQLRYAADTEQQWISTNLHIVATMNSADRNLALVDVALRRRFEFVRLNPRYELVPSGGADQLDARQLLRVLNERIAYLLGPDFAIGHSYLMNMNSNDQIVATFATRILPLLEEYFLGDDMALLLALGEHPEGAPAADRIFRLERPSSEDLEKVFGAGTGEVASSQIAGVRQKPVLKRSVHENFWDFAAEPPGPRDRDYAVRALTKICAPPPVPVPEVLVPPTT